MTARSPGAFMLSALLHGAVAFVIYLFTAASSRNAEDAPRVFELVAGEGDNYLATEAPALGTPGGVRIEVPEPPLVQPEPPAPEPEPIEVRALPPPPKTEPKVAPPPKAEPKAPDFAKKLKQEVRAAENKAKREIKKQREAEARRVAEEQKRISKEEFDRKNKAKASSSSAPTKTAMVKTPKIDAEGIAKGVVGGSPNNKVGGAGGRALTASHDNVLNSYYSLFKQRLRDNFEPPPSTSDSHRVTVEVRSDADGTLSNGRVLKSSGNKEFDDAVLDAVRRVRMPARPDNRSETVQFVFTARERDEG